MDNKNVILICEEFNISESDAILILKEIERIIREEKLEDFILNDLCIFKSKNDAFDWFYDDEKTGKINESDLDIEITKDMVGKDLKNILLECKENYIEVKDDLYITYWF